MGYLYGITFYYCICLHCRKFVSCVLDTSKKNTLEYANTTNLVVFSYYYVLKISCSSVLGRLDRALVCHQEFKKYLVAYNFLTLSWICYQGNMEKGTFLNCKSYYKLIGCYI